MKLYNVSEADLRNIVAEVSVNDYAGNLELQYAVTEGMPKPFVSFTLRVKRSDGPGAQESPRRRTIKASWDAHRDVMAEIFARFPKAKLVSALAVYNGAEDFERKHGDTYYASVGSCWDNFRR